MGCGGLYLVLSLVNCLNRYGCLADITAGVDDVAADGGGNARHKITLAYL